MSELDPHVQFSIQCRIEAELRKKHELKTEALRLALSYVGPDGAIKKAKEYYKFLTS